MAMSKTDAQYDVILRNPVPRFRIFSLMHLAHNPKERRSGNSIPEGRTGGIWGRSSKALLAQKICSLQPRALGAT